MKALGYAVVFGALCVGAYYAASSAPQGNVQLGIFFGMLIPFAMMVVAEINGDF